MAFYDRGPALWDGWTVEPARLVTPRQAPLDWAWVTDQVATGAMPWSTQAVSTLVRAGVTLVVNCSDDLSNPPAEFDHRVRYIYAGVPDDGQWKGPDWFEPIHDAVAPALARGERVYIHCLAGSNRGPSAAYAMLRAVDRYSPGAALDLVANARPRASLTYVEDADAWIAGTPEPPVVNRLRWRP